MIVRESVVLNRTCVDNDGCFDDMSGIIFSEMYLVIL